MAPCYEDSMTSRSFAAAIAATSLLLGTGCSTTTGQLKATAAKDLQCPESQLTVEPVGDQSKYAIGCGQRVLYSYECRKPEGGTESLCGWQMRDARR
jgi:hypothetical protein